MESTANYFPREMEPQQVLQDLLHRMGFEVAIEDQQEEEERLLLFMSGRDAGLLIGKKGQTLDALQYLLNKMLRRDIDEGKPIVLDSEGYRQRRIEALTQLAHRLQEKATRSKKIIAVNPMSAHDRRVIHIALREIPGITTRSEGEGLNRRLLIIPD